MQEDRYGEFDLCPGAVDHLGDVEQVDTGCTRAGRALMLSRDSFFPRESTVPLRDLHTVLVVV